MINVYKDWTGKDFDSYEIEEGRALKDCVDGVNWENAIVFCNGNKINENYILKKGDIVAVREMPGVFSSITSALISIAVMATAFAVAEGISYLATGKGLFENLKDWLTPSIDTPKTPSQQESIPSLKGAKNQNIFGKPVPYIIGQTRMSPYKVGNGYHTVSGTDGDKQRFHCLYAVGYNDLSVGLFKFGESDFAYNGMSETYVNGEYVLSNANRAIKNGRISDFNTKKPAGKANPYLEIASSGELALYPQKVVEEGVGKQIINANGEKLKFTRAAACHAERIEIEVAFNALVAFNDKGEETNASARIGLGISFDGGNTFEPFGRIGSESYTTQNVDASDAAEGITGSLGVTTITRAKNKNMRFVASRSITVNEAQTAENQANGYVWLRIEKEDADSTSTKVTNKAYLSYIRTWCYDKEKSFEKTLNQSTQQYEWTAIGNSLVPQAPIIEKVRDKITRVALELDATDNVTGELDEFNCMVVANCKTWDSENEQWSVSKSPTANPAANIVNLMQSGMLGGFAYSDSRIDLVELGALYEECEEKGFTVGTALTNRKKLYEVIDLILSQCRAYRIASGNKYSVFIDKPIETPVCVLNNSNILKDGASNTKEFRELPDGFKVKFVNKNLGYDEDEVYIMFSEKSYDDPTAIVESVDMPFVTDPKQVAKNAWFEYAKRKLRPELWNRSVTNEANLIEIGSLVELQDDTIRVGLGDGGWIEALVVQNGLIVGMRISSRINISDLTKEYGAKITHSSDLGAPDIRVRKLAVTQAAYADTFAFDTAIATTDENAPAVGDLVSIGEFGRETISAICLNKKDKGDGKFDLTLVPYDENIYTYDQDAKVEFDPKVSGVQADVVDVDTTEYAKREELIQYMSELAGGAYEEIGNPDTPVITNCSARRDGIDVSCAALPYSGLNNALGKVHWQVAKAQSVAVADIVDWTSLPDTPDLSTVYLFDRTVDCYPEWDDLNDVGSKWYFRAKVTNAYNKDSDWSVPVAVNVDNYGTWIVGDPDKVTDRVSGRTATLAFDQEEAAVQRELYGDVYYKIEIRRGDLQSTDWFNPADDEDPYEDEENYKDGGSEALPSSTASTPVTDQYLLAGKRTTHAFTQTLPLSGQNDQMYQFQWYFEGPTTGTNARVDSFGNPRKEGSGTSYSVAPPSADWQAVSKVFGDTAAPNKVAGYFSGSGRTGDAWVHGALGETGSETYPTDIYRYGDLEDVYELIKENGTDYSKAFHNGEYADIDSSGNFTLGGFNWTISGTHVTKQGDTNSCEIFQASKTVTYSLLDGFNPVDTVYQYKVRAFNVFGTDIVSYSDAKIFTVAALATSAKDVIEGAITHNKLSEGAVWVDNLAAGSITAEKMAVRDLFAITGVFGKIQNNQLSASSDSFWDLENGEFRVGNDISLENQQTMRPVSEDNGANYLHFKFIQNPSNPLERIANLAVCLSNFFVSAVASVIKGFFKVINNDGTEFITVNPTTSSITDNQNTTAAKTMKILGDLELTGKMKGAIGHSLTITQTLGGQTTVDTFDGSVDKSITIQGYDQSLNTTDDVKFNSVSFSGHIGELSVNRLRLSGSTLYINC